MPPKSTPSDPTSNPDTTKPAPTWVAPRTPSVGKTAGGPFSTSFAAMILGFWLLDVSLSLLLPRSFLHESELALGARGLLLCYATAVLIALLSAIGMGAMLVLRLE